MMGRPYVATMTAQAVTAAVQDLWDIAPADDKPIRILGFTVGNVAGLGDAGDASEEDVGLDLIRGYATRTGGSAVTAAATESGNAQAAGTSITKIMTTVASAGAPLTVASFSWNVRVEYQMFFPEEIAPVISQADTRVVLRLSVAPADALVVSSTIWFEELV